jgi:hypothetical protein
MPERAARDDDLVDALPAEVLRGELAHLAGSDDQHPAAGELAENLARQLHRREAHRHGALPERRLRAHAFARGERGVKQLAQNGPGSAPLRGDRPRLLDLPEDLRLAHDKRIETRRDAEEMVRGFSLLSLEQVRQERASRHVVVLAKKRKQLLPRSFEVVGDGVDLRAVTCREHDRFRKGGPSAQRFHGGPDVAAGEVEALPQFHGCGAMGHAQQEQMHLRRCGWWSRSS